MCSHNYNFNIAMDEYSEGGKLSEISRSGHRFNWNNYVKRVLLNVSSGLYDLLQMLKQIYFAFNK